ncbi:hypothetical protein NADFUDRAFT_82087 [Nadsonia fulvescens var. elongata DSM 6958]|uniref:Uncharacterized protein n=1 Tax=Nadsonia fulvescens var. elongata DSM 6958 TaxID=857566 RepID=A0A1E3PQG8_9ASCO|nr:hypothetical protein NADFUDRAFT_82087 [Nadsonia fulvescens var. elongata DSM 6958]
MSNRFVDCSRTFLHQIGTQRSNLGTHVQVPQAQLLKEPHNHIIHLSDHKVFLMIQALLPLHLEIACPGAVN